MKTDTPPLKTENQISSTRVAAAILHRINVAQQEIERDIALGLVSPLVESFADLHDHVDANLYVNDAERDDRVFGEAGKAAGFSQQDFIDQTNRMISAIDRWLAGGRADNAIDFIDSPDGTVAPAIDDDSITRQLREIADIDTEEFAYTGSDLDKLFAWSSVRYEKTVKLSRALLADDQYQGGFLPTGFGYVAATPSAKHPGLWQVTFFTQDWEPLSDTGAKLPEDAVMEMLSEGRPALLNKELSLEHAQPQPSP